MMNNPMSVQIKDQEINPIKERENRFNNPQVDSNNLGNNNIGQINNQFNVNTRNAFDYPNVDIRHGQAEENLD